MRAAPPWPARIIGQHMRQGDSWFPGIIAGPWTCVAGELCWGQVVGSVLTGWPHFPASSLQSLPPPHKRRPTSGRPGFLPPDAETLLPWGLVKNAVSGNTARKFDSVRGGGGPRMYGFLSRWPRPPGGGGWSGRGPHWEQQHNSRSASRGGESTHLSPPGPQMTRMSKETEIMKTGISHETACEGGAAHCLFGPHGAVQQSYH